MSALLRRTRKGGEKLVVFSESTKVLDEIEGHLGRKRWIKASGMDRLDEGNSYYDRLDGKTDAKRRHQGVRQFNECAPLGP